MDEFIKNISYVLVLVLGLSLAYGFNNLINKIFSIKINYAKHIYNKQSVIFLYKLSKNILKLCVFSLILYITISVVGN